MDIEPIIANIEEILEECVQTDDQAYLLVHCGRAMGLVECLVSLELITMEKYQEYLAQVKHLGTMIELKVICPPAAEAPQ